MTESEKDRVIQLLKGKGGVIESCLENNLCKAYKCKFSDLDAKLVANNPTALEDMWNKLYQDILPCLQSTLYPLEKHDEGFKIRKSVLTMFREHILMKLLRDVTRSIPDLDRILFAVLMESEGVSAEFIALSNKVTTVKEGPVEGPIVKSRSKTLPNNKASKTVTWQDSSRKSATFCL
ncbi:hypothetical protein WR25_02453 [Diploscapter pachys]|uniref:Uncharacterized protein n=1 Tax=Diploscapter pachys TaxID=2018661 RepID=A0A2A2KKT7_9BILA|nr:hypothetical protein WR25_02453 [Diploscapter pachys]